MTEPEQVVPRAPHHTVSGAPHPTVSGAPHPTVSGASHHTVSGASPPNVSGAPHPEAPDLRRRRLLFRSTHRGTFENDLLIGGFVRAHLVGLTEAEVDALEAVMEMPDNDLADWLTGRVAIPQEKDTPMLRRMRDFHTR
jgi:antitoxin CptB